MVRDMFFILYFERYNIEYNICILKCTFQNVSKLNNIKLKIKIVN